VFGIAAGIVTVVLTASIVVSMSGPMQDPPTLGLSPHVGDLASPTTSSYYLPSEYSPPSGPASEPVATF
jgi:hypothetical protein